MRHVIGLPSSGPGDSLGPRAISRTGRQSVSQAVSQLVSEYV